MNDHDKEFIDDSVGVNLKFVKLIEEVRGQLAEFEALHAGWLADPEYLAHLVQRGPRGGSYADSLRCIEIAGGRVANAARHSRHAIIMASGQANIERQDLAELAPPSDPDHQAAHFEYLKQIAANMVRNLEQNLAMFEWMGDALIGTREQALDSLTREQLAALADGDENVMQLAARAEKRALATAEAFRQLRQSIALAKVRQLKAPPQ